MSKNQNGFGLVSVVLFLVIVLLISLVGTKVYTNQRNQSASGRISSENSVMVLSYEVPRTDCKNVLPKVQDSPSLIVSGGDICYSLATQAGEESIRYVILSQSEEYQTKDAQEYANKCELDCGGSIPITRQDFIIRSNGKVEAANPEWDGQASTAIDYLTGCPMGGLEKYKDVGKFIVENGRIATRFVAKDIAYSSQYGSSCEIDIDLVAYSTSPEPSLKFKKLGVNYDIAYPDVCEQQEDASSREECYSQQAGMRGELQHCNQTLHPTLRTMSGECVKAVAVRTKDKSICKNDPQTSQCEAIFDEYTAYLSGRVLSTGR